MRDITRKSFIERIFHAITFEGIALLICAPIAAWLMNKPVTSVGMLTLIVATIAMIWNVILNIVYDRAQRRFGFRRTVRVRFLHALAYELGLLVVAIPVAAYWLSVSYWQAFLLDFGLLLFFLPYAMVFNASYDKLRMHIIMRQDRKLENTADPLGRM